MKNAILFLMLLFNHAIFSQQKENGDNRIVVLGQATLDFPADQITFTVLISVKDPSDLEKINQNHKIKEKEILKLLKEFKIPQNKISYSLLEIKKEAEYGNNNIKKENIVSEQEVNFTIDSIQQYSKIQAQLLKNGFSEFSSSFSSSKLEGSEKILIEKALEAALKKADIMAKFAKKSIVGIVKIADTEDTEPVLSNTNTAHETIKGAYETAMPSLTQIVQKVSVSKSVKVVFEMK